jgi:putative ABC transport system ATP-binding protein
MPKPNVQIFTAPDPDPADARRTPIVEAHAIGRRHPDGKNWLLEQVSLRLEPGERLAVCGPSGSGKTLLLRALALLDPIDQGQLLWLGRPVHRLRVPEFRSQVMYLHQRPAFFEDQVEAALQAPLLLRVHRHRPFDRDRVVAWLAQLGRDASFLTKAMRSLSGGELQILALVRALSLEPTVLLLDEPTAALDELTARAVEQLLADWVAQRPSRSLVWVSHDAGVQQRAAQRSVRIEAGRIVD